MQSSLAHRIGALTFLPTFIAIQRSPLSQAFVLRAAINHCSRVSPSIGIKMTPTATGSHDTSQPPLEITFVTGNKKKAEEVGRILAADVTSEGIPKFTVANQKIDLPELQGEPVDIAIDKCRLAAEEVGGHVITEDTSLCFNALGGLPGAYIKWFLDKCGHEGLNNMLVGFDDKSAYAQTVVAYCPGPDNDVVTFTGKTDGKIVPARGSLDFGWDPIFQPCEGNGLTYAEMTKEGKDAISHRSRAFAKLANYLAEKLK